MRPLAGSIEGPGSEGVCGCSAPVRGPGRKAWWPQCPVGHGTTGVRGERGNLVLSGPGTAEGTAGRGWGPHGAETPPQKPRRRANTWKTV